MKKLLRIPLLLAVLFLTTLPLSAHDFEVDGIYYNILDETAKTVAVTYSGYHHDSVENEYTGDVSIPNSVTYSETSYSVTFIETRAFWNCTGLTSITIPNSVTSIGYYAFGNCTGLTSVTIPNSVTSISDYAFENCTSLTSVTIGNSVTSIGTGAFKNCTGLTSVTIPNSVILIGYNAFEGCTGLTSVTIGNSVTTIGGSAFSGCTSLTSITIPNSVTSIGSGAFSGCTGLTSVTIGNSVTTIGGSAFSGCTSLTSITIPNSVTSIGTGAFKNCTGLTSITIPNSVTTIGSGAFSGCTGLTSITIPNSVTTIGSGAFSGCTGLTSVVVESGNSVYDSRDNCNAIIETASNTLISGYKNSTIPNSVTSIGKSAFSGCTGLTSVTIPNSVTSISDYAFENCTSLTSVTIGNSVTTIEGSAFSGCTGLTSITIPNSVTTIGERAFWGCTGLTSITIPNSVTTIGERAFWGCTGLTGVHISSIESWLMINMGVFPFYNCECKLILNGTEVTNLTIPTSISQIKSYAFAHCTGLTSITIPNSVTSIGESAFWGCTGLTSVTIGESISEIADYTFNKCDSIKSINFNAINCLSIGKNALPNTTAITYLGIGENVTKIPDFNFKSTIKTLNYDAINCLSGNFYGYTGLATVSIGENVTTIQPNTFSGCTGLTTVNYNALNCTSMGDSDNPVFKDCKITTLNIGGKVTAIPTYAFYRCSSLKTVNISDLSAWCKIDFEEAYIGRYRFISNPLFYAGKLYLNGTEITKLEIPNDVPEIKNYAFYGCRSLTSVTIPNSVTKIDDYAFEACGNLTSLTIPSSITPIGSDAFFNCHKLVNYRLGLSHTTITLSGLTTPTEYTPYFYAYYNQKYMNAGDKITGLAPSTSTGFDSGLIINGTYCRINSSSTSTYSFSVNLRGNATVTTLSATGSHSNGDVTILGEGINIGSSITSYNGNSSIALTGLDPNTTYTVYYGVKIKESSSAYTTSKTFTTGALEWSAGEYQATSTTSVRLMTETTCDATAGTGIEWRRYGAPESLAPNKAECPVVDGMLVGYLKGLNPEAYYEYRPYYTSASGKTYYGEWAAFFSGDAGVYFEPEVRTFTENSVDGNSVTIKGYALPGTDEVTGQGFEYWKASGISTYSTDNVKTVSASGISMSATLSNLDYNSTYCYRAFVTTAKGTTYGDTVEFSTGYPAGIYTVEADKDENTASYRIMPGMLVVNGEGETPVMVADMNGRVLFNGYAAGQLELPLKAGIYILRLGNNAHKVAIR